MFKKQLKYLAVTKVSYDTLPLSSSGGAFILLAIPFLKQGGTVFGSTLDDNGNCYHISISDLDDLIKLQGSKYIRSNINNTYNEAYTNLTLNNKVLYCGTPCQIAGLYAYLKTNCLSKQKLDNLLTIDLFCHGTPPNALFKLYLEWLDYTLNTDDGIHDYRFRDPRFEWGTGYYCSYWYRKNGKVYEVCNPVRQDLYINGFLNSVTLNRQCYNCKYSQSYRVGDISIGDFWNVSKFHDNFYMQNKQYGISSVFINTKKAEDFFMKWCAPKCLYLESSFLEMRQCAVDESNDIMKRKYKQYYDLISNINVATKNKDKNKLFTKLLKANIDLRVDE